MNRIYYFIIGCFLTISCTSSCTSNSTDFSKPNEKELDDSSYHSRQLKKIDDLLLAKSEKEIDSCLLINNLVDVQDYNKNIRLDLKYASTDNFVKKKLYQRINRAFLQKDVAARLAKCQTYLTKIDSGLHLLIYDAVRPVNVQWIMWNALDTIPAKDRGKFVSNPVSRSVHNFGAAVDLTICNSMGEPLDMGAGYDDLREIAYPSLESKFLATGELTKAQVANRTLLRKVMRSQYFRNIPTEWWHFNACSRAEAMLKYQILKSEPEP